MYQKIENEDELRRFFIQSYVIVYKIKENEIRMFRILPSKSNYIQEGIYKNKIQKNLEIKIK